MLFLQAALTAVGVSVGIGHASSSIRDSLRERFTLSRIEVQNLSDEGRVDRVRLFAHTLEPLRLPNGRAARACTEFVFLFDPDTFDPDTLDRTDIRTVADRINRWPSTT